MAKIRISKKRGLGEEASEMFSKKELKKALAEAKKRGQNG